MGTGESLQQFSKVGVTDEEKLLIRTAILSCNVKFVRIDDPIETLWTTHITRNTLSKIGDSVKRTATQRMLDVWEAKLTIDTEKKTSLGVDKIAEYWRTQLGEDRSGCVYGILCFYSLSIV